MEASKVKFATVDEYIASFPPPVQTLLHEIRGIIRKEVPQAEEVISYGMPGYRLNGLLVWFAGNKEHIGFYPSASPIVVFKKELEAYKTSKGAIQFTFDKPFPETLIQKIVRYRVKENEEKMAQKKMKKIISIK
ncbi:MAG TPA: DUF1801 domain-containing protein [Bacteroidia bacterium]|nr:DUF1801 domain-containing protein [Bacteroidia bacterium]